MSEKAGVFKQYFFGDIVAGDRPLSASDARKLISRGRELKGGSLPPAQGRIMEVFSRLSAAWSDPAYPKRRMARDVLMKSTGLSREFIEAVLTEFPKLLDPASLLKKIEGEFGSPSIQEEPALQESTGVRLLAGPAGLVLHVASGNVFLGGVDSLIDGIITRNVNFLKMSTDEREFPVLFAEGIKELDRDGVVAKRIAVLWWKGGEDEIESLFKKSMDRIIFWGGDEALSKWEDGLGPQTGLSRHGHKVSFGIVSRAGLQRADLSGLTDRIVLDIAAWEQKACNCPQAIFVERTVAENEMKAFIDSLTGSFRRVSGHFPPGRKSDDECVEVLRARELALAESFMTGKGVKVLGPQTLDWTIIYEDGAQKEGLFSSPLNRTVLVKRYSAIEDLSVIFKGHEFYLQTAGYCLDEQEVVRYAKHLSPLGVTRLCPFGKMTIPTSGAPHDGAYPLRELSRLAVIE